tara:strand:+ start:319 stop:501 length:183 start_codon:yes stop_codon:yes gene_type:complete
MTETIYAADSLFVFLNIVGSVKILAGDKFKEDQLFTYYDTNYERDVSCIYKEGNHISFLY